MISTKVSGKIFFADFLRVIERSGGGITPTGGKLLVIEPDGEVTTHEVERGSQVYVKHGQHVEAGAELFAPDAHEPLIAEVKAEAVLIDCVEGVSVARQIDEVTGLSSLVVIKQLKKKVHYPKLYPRILLSTGATWSLCSARLPEGTVIYEYALKTVVPGSVLARSPKIKD